MTLLEFADVVETAKRKNPVWFDLDSDPLATNEEIATAEKLLQTRFPAQYLEFITRYGGGLFAFVNIASVSPSSEWNAVHRNQKIKKLDFIAVSENGVGDYYGFRTEHGICLPEVFF